MYQMHSIYSIKHEKKGCCEIFEGILVHLDQKCNLEVNKAFTDIGTTAFFVTFHCIHHNLHVALYLCQWHNASTKSIKNNSHMLYYNLLHIKIYIRYRL